MTVAVAEEYGNTLFSSGVRPQDILLKEGPKALQLPYSEQAVAEIRKMQELWPQLIPAEEIKPEAIAVTSAVPAPAGETGTEIKLDAVLAEPEKVVSPVVEKAAPGAEAAKEPKVEEKAPEVVRAAEQPVVAETEIAATKEPAAPSQNEARKPAEGVVQPQPETAAPLETIQKPEAVAETMVETPVSAEEVMPGLKLDVVMVGAEKVVPPTAEEKAAETAKVAEPAVVMEAEKGVPKAPETQPGNEGPAPAANAVQPHPEAKQKPGEVPATPEAVAEPKLTSPAPEEGVRPEMGPGAATKVQEAQLQGEARQPAENAIQAQPETTMAKPEVVAETKGVEPVPAEAVRPEKTPGAAMAQPERVAPQVDEEQTSGAVNAAAPKSEEKTPEVVRAVEQPVVAETEIVTAKAPEVQQQSEAQKLAEGAVQAPSEPIAPIETKAEAIAETKVAAPVPAGEAKPEIKPDAALTEPERAAQPVIEKKAPEAAKAEEPPIVAEASKGGGAVTEGKAPEASKEAEKPAVADVESAAVKGPEARPQSEPGKPGESAAQTQPEAIMPRETIQKTEGAAAKPAGTSGMGKPRPVLRADRNVLLDAVQKAVLKSPDVLAKWETFRAVIKETDAARGGYFPRLDVTASRGRETYSSPYITPLSMGRHGATMTLTQILYDGLATRNEVNRLTKVQLVRYYELLDASETAALEALRAYYEVVRTRKLFELTEDNYVAHRKAYEHIKQKVLAGVGRRVDLEQASGRLALSKSNLTLDNANVHDASAKYQRIVGELPPAELVSPDSEATQEKIDQLILPNAAAATLSVAVESHPAILAAVENVRAAKYDLSSRFAKYQPTINLQVSRSTNFNYSGVAGKTRDATAEVVMSWNLFSGGADRARSKQAASLLEAARDQRDKACRDIRMNLEIAYNDIAKLKEQLEFMDQHQIAIGKAVIAYQKQFEIGQRSLLDVLDSENELYQAKRSYTNAQYDLYIARARTVAGMGQLAGSLGLARLETPDLPEKLGVSTDGPETCLPEPALANVYSIDDLNERAKDELEASKPRRRPASPELDGAEDSPDGLSDIPEGGGPATSTNGSPKPKTEGKAADETDSLMQELNQNRQEAEKAGAEAVKGGDDKPLR